MWEGACPRWRRASQHIHRLTHRYRGQAPSHTGIRGITLYVSRLRQCKLPRPRCSGSTQTQCGRGLAPDGGEPANTSLTDPPQSGASPLPHGYQRHHPLRKQVETVQAAPAPMLRIHANPMWEGACPRWRRASQHIID
ncbi:hypothetical protein PspCFBP13528_07005 [Pseudomonas sp. CFBP13528]|nr:hypothetical protein PspCFBP13528_07005 [Pseudomonas sp. CFBP13528]